MPVTPVPGVIAEAGVPWQKAAPVNTERCARFEAASQFDVTAVQSAKNAQQKIDRVARVRFGEAPRRDVAARSPWGAPKPRHAATLIRWVGMLPVANIERTRVSWGRPGVVDRQPVASPYINVLPKRDTHSAVPWRSTNPHASELAAAPKPRDVFLVSWRRHIKQKDLFSAIPWGPLGARDTTLRFVYPTYTGEIVLPGEPPSPLVQVSYYFMNLVTVVRLPDRTPIHMHNVSMSLDVDSWAWSLSGEVQGAASLSLIAPTAAGPVDIEVSVNGFSWVFMIESYTGNRLFADDGYSVKGVSRTQLLAAPYAPLRSAVVASQINAKQLVDEQLLYTGFTMSWDSLTSDETTPDWTIPAGAWAYRDQTPVQVIKAVANAAGAVLLPVRDSDALRIQPRFRISPWALAGAVPDAALAMGMVSSVGLTWSPRPLYNAVHVSGSSAGVGYLATRAGTAGDAPAPDVVDDLAVAVEVNRERARQVMSASGNQAVYTFTLPLPESGLQPGLIEPGAVLEVVEGADAWRGYVLSNTVSFQGDGALDVSQQVSVVRFYEHG